eukprot:6207220-Prymnesium_polylepis.1
MPFTSGAARSAAQIACATPHRASFHRSPSKSMNSDHAPSPRRSSPAADLIGAPVDTMRSNRPPPLPVTPRRLRSAAISPEAHAASSAAAMPNCAASHHGIAASCGWKTRGVCADVSQRVAAAGCARPRSTNASAAAVSLSRRCIVMAAARWSLKHDGLVSIVAYSSLHSAVSTSAVCHSSAWRMPSSSRASTAHGGPHEAFLCRHSESIVLVRSLGYAAHASSPRPALRGPGGDGTRPMCLCEAARRTHPPRAASLRSRPHSARTAAAQRPPGTLPSAPPRSATPPPARWCSHRLPPRPPPQRSLRACRGLPPPPLAAPTAVAARPSPP